MHDAFNGITTVVSHRRPLNARKTIKCDPSIKYYKTEISNNKIDLIKQCLPVVLFIIFDWGKVAHNLEFVDEIILQFKLLRSTFVFAVNEEIFLQTVQRGSNFWVRGLNRKLWPLRSKATRSTFLCCCLTCRTRWFWLSGLWINS